MRSMIPRRPEARASIFTRRDDASPYTRRTRPWATGGLFRAINQPMIACVRFVYRLGQGDLQDLPRWVYNDRFDIEARANGDPTRDQMRLLLRSLLIERFRLATHTEQRTQAVFASRAISARA